jgi:polyhydroxybutyrate depolymerase
MILFSVALLVVGIFKPEWVRFQQKQLGRITIIAVAIGICMIGAGAIYYAGNNNAEAVSRGKILGEAVYAVDNHALRCDPGTKPGHAGASNDEQTPAGIRYMVKTPVNYNANIAHPLLMVYAPAQTNRYESEDFVHLTQEATAAGFIVAYADHRTMTPKAIEELAEIPGLIEKKWCIDKKQTFLTGHSDGGTIAMGIAFINGTKHIPRQLLPVQRASGVRT